MYRQFHENFTKIWQHCQLTNVEAKLIVDSVANKGAVVSRKISRHLALTKCWTGHAEEAKGIVNFGYDGRKDLTLQPKQKLKRESHITFVGDDGEYLNHTTMANDEGEEIAGTAENLAQKIFDVLEETESVDTVTFISSDGTNVNTGHEGNF